MNHFYEINENFLKRYDDIEINFEGYFTTFEFKVIQEISRYLDLKINFIYNQYNKKNQLKNLLI